MYVLYHTWVVFSREITTLKMQHNYDRNVQDNQCTNMVFSSLELCCYISLIVFPPMYSCRDPRNKVCICYHKVFREHAGIFHL